MLCNILKFTITNENTRSRNLKNGASNMFSGKEEVPYFYETNETQVNSQNLKETHPAGSLYRRHGKCHEMLEEQQF